MAMLHDVYDNLRAMTLLHLLLAFLACTGYVLAEGQLASKRVRVAAGLTAAASAAWFVIDSPQWTAGAMLVALAIGGVGVFTALVWAMSAALGLRTDSTGAIDLVPAIVPTEAALATASMAHERRQALVGNTHSDALHSH